jgi:ribonucleoside-diphosphate reductase alpha chain
LANWSPDAIKLLEARYLRKNEVLECIETPDAMLNRVATAVSDPETTSDREAWKYKFYKSMNNLDFLPNSPCLMNAGSDNQQLLACFLLEIPDSIEGIFDMVKLTALIHKSGGGTGLSFSRLRGRHTAVTSSGGYASGPVSFMRAFGVATDVVAQGGRRRGANLGLLDIGHPNIMSFISCKESTEDFSSFNISASVTDEFMDCLRKGSQFTLVDPKSVSETQIDPQEIWDALIYQAWLTGEPGVFFVDTANRYNTVPWVGDIVGTNPCGESPLRNFESCDLGSINITNFVDVKNRTFDYPRLAEVVETSIRFLDNMITVNDFTDPRISDTTKQTRKVGLGIMGWADALLMLGVPYDTQPARCLAYELAGFMMSVAERTSQALAVEKGPAPCYRRRKNKFRNATVMSIAPTGSISILANCSNSIEPIFSREYTRKVLDGDLVMSKKYTSASVRTALEISPLNHLKMQKAFQCWVDLACSKTINLPESATVGDVANVYKLAYEMQLKGVTVYRQGSRKDAPIKCDSGVCPL